MSTKTGVQTTRGEVIYTVKRINITHAVLITSARYPPHALSFSGKGPPPASLHPSPLSKARFIPTLMQGHRLSEHWQADIKAAVSEGLSERQTHWQTKKFRDY